MSYLVWFWRILRQEGRALRDFWKSDLELQCQWPAEKCTCDNEKW